MVRGRLFYRIWLAVTLTAFIGFPVWKLVSARDQMNSACFTITDIQVAPLAGNEFTTGGPLALLADSARSGNQRICTDHDSYARSTVEAEWNRITVLEVKLDGPASDIITASPATNTSPEEFYAEAVHKVFLAVRLQVLQEIAFGEAVGVALAALSWCIGHLFVSRR